MCGWVDGGYENKGLKKAWTNHVHPNSWDSKGGKNHGYRNVGLVGLVGGWVGVLFHEEDKIALAMEENATPAPLYMGRT